MTPNSSTSSYCTPSIFVTELDFRPFAQLVSDTGQQVYATAAAMIAGPDAVLAHFLLLGAGMIESAALKGELYAVADLQALTGASQALLQWMNCYLTAGLLTRRRPSLGIKLPEEFMVITGEGGWLDQLARGHRIFSFVETEAAGLVETHDLIESDIWLKRSAVNQARRYWGRRAQDRFTSPT